MAASAGLLAHLKTGATHMCRCWAITRKDGVVLGFTDHDLALDFEGIEFRPNSGLTARALEQTTGLSVDNTEALGVLSASAINEADIQAGRYDGAGVRSWLVNWDQVDLRQLQFKGSIGEIQRSGDAFQAELRGLSEVLNQPQGRVFQKPCSAILGDAACSFDLNQPGFATETEVVEVRGGKFLDLAMPGFEDRWFERGRLQFLTGAAAGVAGIVKNDRTVSGGRSIELWEKPGAPVQAGDRVQLNAGCDRRAGTCRLKFDNLVNFQGFPDIPGEDWLMSVPKRNGQNDGRSRKA